MEADREIPADALQHAQVVAAGAEVVFAVDLDEAERGPRAQKIRVMRGAQPDSRAERFQLLFSVASLPGWPWTRLPPICKQVPAFTTLKSFGS